jgi:hypothetical protein
LRAAPVRAAAALRGVRLLLVVEPGAELVVSRLANLAVAAEPEASVRVADAPADRGDADDIVVVITARPVSGDRCVMGSSRGDEMTSALAGAVRASLADGAPTYVSITGGASDDHSVQALAASLLDGLCLGLTRD